MPVWRGGGGGRVRNLVRSLVWPGPVWPAERACGVRHAGLPGLAGGRVSRQHSSALSGETGNIVG